MDKISVIIPTKDRLLQLKKAIPLYLRQAEVGEVIVIIDGSTDGTREYLEQTAVEEPRLKFLDNGINKGIPYSRNRGIAAVQYSFTFSTEDDLEITKDFFKTLLEHMEKNNADIIASRNIFRLDSESATTAIERADKMKGNPINPHTIEIETGIVLDKDTAQPMIASPMLGKTEVFRKVRFDEMYKVNYWREETDFQISAIRAGYKLISCPHALCFNFMITKDKGGVRATVGMKRAKWVILNNWHFVQKHRVFIAENFSIGNRYSYIIMFSIRKIVTEVIFPMLSPFKNALTRKPRSAR